MELKYIIIIVAIVFLLLVLLGLAIVNYSGEDLYDKYLETSKYSTGATPVEFAQNLNRLFFNGKIKIKFKKDLLCDSYNGNGLLTLCSQYANSNNMAGLVICAHEIGHAFQFKEQPKLMKKHFNRIKLSKLICWLTSPLLISGIVFLIASELYVSIGLIAGGLLTFIVAVISKVSTFKIEKDASKRALELLSTYANFTDSEIKIAKGFLNSAKQTYLAELLKVVLAWTMLVKKR